jgi:hypothetical protein
VAWGLVALARDRAKLPIGRWSIILEEGAATLFAGALCAAGAALFAHAFLTCLEPIKHRGATGARLAAGLALLLSIAALTHHAVV